MICYFYYAKVLLPRLLLLCWKPVCINALSPFFLTQQIPFYTWLFAEVLFNLKLMKCDIYILIIMQTKLNLWYGSWTCRGYFMTWLWVSRKSASLKERNSLFKCFLSDISKTGFCLMPCQFYRNLGQGCGSVSWASGLHILVLQIKLPSSPGVNFQCSCCAQSYALTSLHMLKIPGIGSHALTHELPHTLGQPSEMGMWLPKW